MEKQLCASVFVINDDKLLLMYNKKLDKWLQPGGHIEEGELPHEAAVRECLEETGIEVEIINETEYANPSPFAMGRYINKVGDMIDLQYYGYSVNTVLKNDESNSTGWYTLDEMSLMQVEEDIINKFKICLSRLKGFKLERIKEEVL